MRKRKNSQQPDVKAVRVMVMGQDGVGKTALVVRYLTRRFIGEYDTTLESTHRHPLTLGNDFIYIDLMDTAGENSDAKLERCLSCGDMFLILYSIVDRTSFDEASRIARYLKWRKFPETGVLILIGTKRDLGHLREIDETEGSELAEELECPFYELSASEYEGYTDVCDMVYTCLKKYLKSDRKTAPTNAPATPTSTPTSSLSKMKEGLMRKTGAMRRKSVTALV
ncbi:ras-related and estrogen-regulated growth inhibitor [Nematostella vectensis]|uniref:ras-related and estrogen-regulated growth inhibitor n=1 Tax=Nematostella vectensis TaxID=45351 RepID=UPI0020774F8D|nr:ras-related and estrogen-regulated growth inhibitor [Nematostella vectensis]XP_032240131.2 ras-related and estrogen-regulated growth inhibitor [Nematostella vectensis]